MSPLLALAALLIGLLLTGLEWRRTDRSQRARRVVASSVAVASLALLAARRPEAGAGSAVGIIVTAGADDASVRRLADSARASIYVMDDAGDASRFGASALGVPDVPFLRRHFPAMTRVAVAGWGLAETDLEALRGLSVAFAAAPVPSGIVTLRWTAALALGSRLWVRGTTTGIAPGTWVWLNDPSGSVDSARIAGDSTFALSSLPRAAARLRYAVRIVRERRTLAAETLGVAITRRPPPRLLILDGAPTFETRYLRDWIAAEGGTLTIRTEISRDRYRTTSVNRPVVELSHIDSATLAQYDAVLLDSRSLSALRPSEREAFLTAVRADGLGLVVRADAIPARPEPLLAGFALSTAGGAAVRAARLSWDGEAGGRAVGLTPVTLRADWTGEQLVSDSADEPVVMRRPAGTGAIAVTVVATPSRWQLAGEGDRFASYWSMLLGDVARPAEERWIVDAPALVDAPVRLTRRGRTTMPVATVEHPDGTRDSVYMAEDAVLAGVWHGTVWPRTPGWYRVTGDSAALDFDVRPVPAWQTLREAARRRATARAAGGAGLPAAGGSSRPWAGLLPSLAFLAFVAAAATLWSERPAR